MSHHDDVIEEMRAAVHRADQSPGWAKAVAEVGPDSAYGEHTRRLAVAAADAIPAGTVKVDSRFAEAVEVGELRRSDVGAVVLLCADGSEHRWPGTRGRLFFVPEDR